jgi:hypothetical protein
MILCILGSFCTIPFLTGLYSNDFFTEAIGSFVGSMTCIWLIQNTFNKYKVLTTSLMHRDIAIKLFAADLHRNHRIPASFQTSEQFTFQLAFQNQSFIDAIKVWYEPNIKNTLRIIKLTKEDFVVLPESLVNLLVITINTVNHTTKFADEPENWIIYRFMVIENIKWTNAILNYAFEYIMNFIANTVF